MVHNFFAALGLGFATSAYGHPVPGPPPPPPPAGPPPPPPTASAPAGLPPPPPGQLRLRACRDATASKPGRLLRLQDRPPDPPPSSPQHNRDSEKRKQTGPVSGDMLNARGLPSADDTSETEASADPGQVPIKRMKVESVTKDLEGGSNSGREEVTQQMMTPAAATGGSGASPAAPIDTPPRLRVPPFPKTGDVNDVHKWNKEWRRVSRILAKDPRLQLPTRRKPNDPDTTNAVLRSRDKVVVRCAARSIVNITSTMHDGSNGSQCTGIIMHQLEDNGKKRTLILTCSKIVCSGKKLLDPVPKLSVGLPNRTILDGQFLFFNDHYGIALLEVDTDCPLQPSSIGSGLEYGEEVFVLARGDGLSLRVRQGEVLWLEESDYMGRSYQMFLSCELPMAGNGGPVIDHEGNVKGMAFYCNPYPAVLSISTIMTCYRMWLKFSCIARPIHCLRVRTIALLDVSLQDEISLVHGVDSGFIVDKVRDDSAADRLGILPGDVIVSLNGHHALTLPELEDYFLHLGWTFLSDRSSTVDLNLEVYDLMKKSKRSITLPVPFCDV